MKRTWLFALAVAGLGALADAVAAELIDKRVFNFGDGIINLFEMFAIGAIIAVFSWYLSRRFMK